MEYIFETKDVTFEDVIAYSDMRIEKGRFTFIVGESGCGKSTLFKLFNKTANYSHGKILFEGRDMNVIDPMNLRQRVTLVRQSAYLFPGTMEENFRKFYEYRGTKQISVEEMQMFLSLCCAPFPLDKDCSLLSGGEKQRVYLAVALSFSSDVLMLDEPTSALDTKTAQQVMQQVTNYCKKNRITLLVVSHDSQITEQFAERVITLNGGKE